MWSTSASVSFSSLRRQHVNTFANPFRLRPGRPAPQKAWNVSPKPSAAALGSLPEGVGISSGVCGADAVGDGLPRGVQDGDWCDDVVIEDAHERERSRAHDGLRTRGTGDPGNDGAFGVPVGCGVGGADTISFGVAYSWSTIDPTASVLVVNVSLRPLPSLCTSSLQAMLNSGAWHSCTAFPTSSRAASKGKPF